MVDNDELVNKRAAQERMHIFKLGIEDLRDKYLNVYEENILLKKHARKQEDKIKKLATKLIRLMNDKKKGELGQYGGSIGKKGAKDTESDEYIIELEEKVAELEQLNKKLKENLQTTKIQLQTLQQQKNQVGHIYNNVSSRIDTGIPKRDSSFTRNVRTISTQQIRRQVIDNGIARSNVNDYEMYEDEQMDEVPDPRYSASNFAPHRESNFARESLNLETKAKIRDYENQIRDLQDQLHEQRRNHEDAMFRLKNQLSHDQVLGVQENIDQIRLQRELKDKSNQYTELYSKFANLNQQHVHLKDNHDRLLDEIERYNQQLKQEQQRVLALKTDLKNSSHYGREILELKERISDLSRENEALKEANEKLLNSAFSLERERDFREKERAMKIQIVQLESAMKSDVNEKGTILDRLNHERELYDKLNKEFKEMQTKYFEMKEKYDDMNDKMMFLSKESNIDFTEIHEALIIVKERRAEKNTDEFSKMVDSEKIKIYQRKIQDLEAQLIETIGELEKTRHMLIAQVKINQEYKNEFCLIQSKMEENKAEYDAKVLDMAQKLDQRADKIRKLERQLRDVFYGTKQVNIANELQEYEMVDASGKKYSTNFVGAPTEQFKDHNLIADLEAGQNIFEIHLFKLVLSDEALRIMKEKDPLTFCSIEFFEHQLQCSPVVKGSKPEYNFTVHYRVRVDDFFLHYLQKEKTIIELNQSTGSSFFKVAACAISFQELIEEQKKRMNGSVQLICLLPDHGEVSFGQLDFSARLLVPVDEAFKLYKERTKALGYIASNKKNGEAIDTKKIYPSRSQKQRSEDNMNELSIILLRCIKVFGLEKDKQPDLYCVYKFYDFSDHDTEIIPSTNMPEFQDLKAFVVPMDIDLDKYLKNNFVEVFVFDNQAPEDSGQFLGLAKIPLIGLTHDQDIKGTFELTRFDGKPNGAIDIILQWKFAYLPPPASTFASSGSKHPVSIKKSDGSEQPASQPLPERMQIESKLKKIGVNVMPPSTSNKQPLKSALKSKNSSQQRSIEEQPHRRVSQADQSQDEDIGNQTLTEGRRRSNASINQDGQNTSHLADTMFGDEDAEEQSSPRVRTYSPEELDSLKKVYQSNVVEEEADPVDDENVPEDEIEDEASQSGYRRTGYPRRTDPDSLGGTGQSENDVVVTRSWDPNGTNAMAKEGNQDNVVIEIFNFSLNDRSDALKRDDIKRLFVSMENFNLVDQNYETNPMPKPRGNEPVHFNFREVITIDSEDKRDRLAQMLEDKNLAVVRFAVVSEPDENDENGECEDFGFAYVDIYDILRSNQNYIDKELKIFHPTDHSKEVGKMTVTVDILDALLAVQRELNIPLGETY